MGITRSFFRWSSALLGGCLLLWLQAAEPKRNRPVEVVKPAEIRLTASGKQHQILPKLMQAAQPTIGVPYRWGGTRLLEGIDCSNYTWQLYRSLGLGYARFLSTKVMSRLTRANGLRRVSFEEAAPGDLLIYGHQPEKGSWNGHVVILIDKDGSFTGHPGLTLGAHGGAVNAVQYITYSGFEEGFFKEPRMRLVNVLRAVTVSERNASQSAE